jgi:CheY-like chemotaxis protein
MALPAKRPVTVFAVDDEATVLDLLVDVLNEMGFETLTAPDGYSALNLLAQAGPVDLLVTDVRMPGMTGWDLAKRVRQQRPGLKVLFITGYAADTPLAQSRLECGMSILPKPFTMAAFAATIRRLVA